MKKLFFFLILIFMCAVSKAQDIDETLKWLNENVGTTFREGKLTYQCEFAFSEKSVHIIGGPNASNINWSRIVGLAITSKGKVYLAFSGQSYAGKTEAYFEYVTPKEGVLASEVLSRLADMCKATDNHNVKFWPQLGDADESYYRIKEEAERRKQENPNDLSPQELAKQKADGEAFLTVLSLLGNFWEVSGTASFTNPITYESNNYAYKPNKAYELMDARFSLVYGKRNLTLNLSPGLSWMNLPSFKKYSSNGTLLDYTDFGQIKFFSPSIGLSWKFMSKKNKNDDYRNAEFPFTVSFAPLLSGKTNKITVKNEAYDTKFADYIDGFAFNIHASIGANLYVGKGFGIGVSVGGTYINIKTSKEKLTETYNSSQRSFTIKMDDLKPYIPRFEFKLIQRMF